MGLIGWWRSLDGVAGVDIYKYPYFLFFFGGGVVFVLQVIYISNWLECLIGFFLLNWIDLIRVDGGDEDAVVR